MTDFKAKMHQIWFRLGLRPRPRWRSLQRSPRPPSWIWGLLLRRGKGREGRKGEGKGGEGRGGEGKGGKGRGRGRKGPWAPPPHTIWRKFTPMVPPLPPNPGYATATQAWQAHVTATAHCITTTHTIRYDTIRYDSEYLACSKKLTGSQLSPPHGTSK